MTSTNTNNRDMHNRSLLQVASFLIKDAAQSIVNLSGTSVELTGAAHTISQGVSKGATAWKSDNQLASDHDRAIAKKVRALELAD